MEKNKTEVITRTERANLTPEDVHIVCLDCAKVKEKISGLIASYRNQPQAESRDAAILALEEALHELRL